MTLEELKKETKLQDISLYIESIFSYKWRKIVKRSAVLLTLASFATALFGSDPLFDGVALLFFSIFLMLATFEGFYNSSKFTKAQVEYAVAQAIFESEEKGLTKSFLDSNPGKILFFRLGIEMPEIESSVEVEVEEDPVTFSGLAKALYEADKELSSYLSTHSINSAEFLGASEWIGHELQKEWKRERWWGRDNLLAIASIGTSLDYGLAYELSKYGRALPTLSEDVDLDDGYRTKEITQLETILSRAEEANALIIDDDESVPRTILGRLKRKIQIGKASPSFRNKNIIELDWTSLVADKKQKGELEAEMLKLLRGAEAAGNIIIYIRELPSFMGNVKSIGVNLSGLLEEFLHSKSLQIVGHATKADFHYFIETNQGLIRMFERLIPEEEGVEASIPVVLEKARELEAENRKDKKIFFSYPAVLSITEAAERYITYGEMPSKAVDLIIEITPWAQKQDIKMLLSNDVARFISEKTGVVSGEIGKGEAEKLEKLEEILHKRIVGQNEAVAAIGSALRRARSGITDPKRPFASFLFLGPTGVGKTETSKTLAESFFGAEDKMIRFDMSEFNGPEALPGLIGSYSENKSGVLASKIRDNPYGVLLLDEFEKASPDVRDLFLQILDEGEFTDAIGNKVNCRNLIIIATSNAGSSLIWKMVEEKIDLNSNKQKIIDFLIEDRIYKPELINRFDGVIIFHPLLNNELEEVAGLEFDKLAKRIKKEKDIEIKMSPSLLNLLVKNAGETEFGARAINRLLQEKVEDFVARKIISQEVGPGQTLEITS